MTSPPPPFSREQQAWLSQWFRMQSSDAQPGSSAETSGAGGGVSQPSSSSSQAASITAPRNSGYTRGSGWHKGQAPVRAPPQTAEEGLGLLAAVANQLSGTPGTSAGANPPSGGGRSSAADNPAGLSRPSPCLYLEILILTRRTSHPCWSGVRESHPLPPCLQRLSGGSRTSSSWTLSTFCQRTGTCRSHGRTHAVPSLAAPPPVEPW